MRKPKGRYMKRRARKTPISPLMDECVAEIPIIYSEITQQNYHRRLTQFHKWLNGREYTNDNAISFLVEQRKTRPMPAVFNTEKAIRYFYKWLVRKGIHQEFKLGKQMFRYESPKRGPDWAVTEKEYAIFRSHLMKEKKLRYLEWYGFVTVAWNTGLRRSDIFSLKWGMIDMDQRVIKIVPRKTKRSKQQAVLIPILPDLFIYLGSRDGGTGYIFPELAQLNGCETAQGWKGIQRAVGIHKGTHAFRHRFISTALNRGIPIPAMSGIMGISPDMIMRYHHATLEENRNFLKVME